MEKSTAGLKSKNKILKLLPKAAQAAAVSFQNPNLFSPRASKWHDLNVNRLRAHAGKGIPGQLVPMIPPEARRRTKNSDQIQTREPTSPKVSCMGQIKQKKDVKKEKRSSLPKEQKSKPVSKTSEFSKSNPTKARPPAQDEAVSAQEKKPSKGIRNIFTARRKSDASADRHEAPLTDCRPAPCLSQMKKFASSRDTFANFDWTNAQVAPAGDDNNDVCSDREDSGDEGDRGGAAIPFSAPISAERNMRGSGSKPRKEINIWKRRTMEQPKPLQLNCVK